MSCSICEFFVIFFGVACFVSNCNIHSTFLCRIISLFIFDGNVFVSIELLKVYLYFVFVFVHIYPPFTRKRIVSLYFGRDVRTRLGVAIFFEVSGPPVFHIKAEASR